MFDDFSSDVETGEPGAYVIIHKASGVVYVGSAGNLYTRHQRHLSNLNKGVHHNHALQDAFNQDPALDFLVYPTQDRQAAFDKEQELLDIYFPKQALFNVATDAMSPRKGAILSAETKQKLSDAARRSQSEETKQKISASMTGKLLGVKQERSKSVIIDGVEYDGVLSASVALNLSYNTVYARVNSSSDVYSEWRWHK